MTDLSWASRTLTLADVHLSEHGADIGRLHAAGVPQAQARALYPAEPAAYWRGISALIIDPRRGRELLAAFPTGARDMRTTAAKLHLLGDLDQEADFNAALSECAERASIEYLGLGIAGPWGSILDLYALPTVLHALLEDPGRCWDSWPPQNLEYLLAPFKVPSLALSAALES